MCSGIPDCFSQRPGVGAVPCGSLGPILVPVVALLITRKIQVADWRLNFFILPLLLYCFGVVADIMAFWISTGGSVFFNRR